MKHRLRFAFVTACGTALGCQATPSEPAPERDTTLAPSAAVLTRGEVFPFWKRGPVISSDGDHAVLYFYVKDPGTIPADFNLLDFFDFRALDADFAVETLEIRESEGDPVPRKVYTSATAPLEFWIVPTPVLVAAAEDGFLGAAELLATGQVLVGHASTFGEELHPTGGPAQQVLLHVQAGGALEAGGSFRVTVSGHFNQQTGDVDGVARVRLTFD